MSFQHFENEPVTRMLYLSFENRMGLSQKNVQILEDRYDRKSIIITSQLPLNTWYEYLGEPTLADAIMDRLAAGAHKLRIERITLNLFYAICRDNKRYSVQENIWK